jgi:hypothetical protein
MPHILLSLHGTVYPLHAGTLWPRLDKAASFFGGNRPVFQGFPKGITFQGFANPLASLLPRKPFRFAVNLQAWSLPGSAA